MANLLHEPDSDSWGGEWTKTKVDIFIKYLPAYLSIMKKQNCKLVYFDGFAGSGKIVTCYDNIMESVALQVLSIENPRPFDMYYLVDLCKEKVQNLKDLCSNRFPNKNIHIVDVDCNKKLIGLANFL